MRVNAYITTTQFRLKKKPEVIYCANILSMEKLHINRHNYHLQESLLMTCKLYRNIYLRK